ncbi:MAG: hypothetical protein NC415_13670 [bacterium]|nr:hypothetical protein [bacterium]
MDNTRICRWCALAGDKLNLAFCNGVLAEYDISTGKIEQMGAIAGLNLGKIISGPTFVYQNKIFIVEYKGKEVFVLDKDDRALRAIPVGAGDESFRNYYGYCLYQECLYLFPHKGERYLAIDCRTEKCSLVLNKRLYDMFVINEDTACARKENRLFFLPRSGEKIFYVDFDTNQTGVIKLQEKIDSVRQILWREDGLYILTGSGEIYLWTGEDVLHKINDAISEKPVCFSRFVNIGDRFWILPVAGEDIYYFDRKAKELSVYRDYPADHRYLREEEWLFTNAKYLEYTANDHYVCFLNRSTNQTLFFDKRTGAAFWREIKVTALMRAKFFRANGGDYFLNEEDVSLEEFVKRIENKNILEWEEMENEKNV